MTKNKTSIKVEESTRELINAYRRQLEAIENNKVTNANVIERIMAGEDILRRLKKGALERREKGI